MTLVSMLIGGVRGKDKANGVVFVWPCGVNIEGLYAKNSVSTPGNKYARNEKAFVHFLAHLSLLLTFDNKL